MGLLGNKVAVVFGAAGGLGSAIARALAAEGATVAVSVRRKGSAQEVLAEIAQDAKGIAFEMVADITNEGSVANTIDEIVKEYGKLDIMVNSSGIIVRKSLLDHTLEDWQRVMAVTLDGAFLTSKYAARQMMKQGSGKIIHIGSIASYTGYSFVAYTSSKAAVLNLVRTMAMELGPFGINVNCLCPGLVKTKLNKDLLESNKALYDKSVKKVPLRRLGSPEDIAAAAVFLASDNANYINGAGLVVDGGATSHFTYYSGD